MSSAARGGPRTGFLRNAWDAAVNFVLKKEVVGTDKHGNKYYRYFETDRGITTERREVKWNTIYVMYDPKDIPSEWRMWLRKLRDDPPTEAESARSDAKAEVLQSRVAALDEQERLRRLRMQSMGMHAHQSSQQPDMSRFLQQMGPNEGAGAGPGSQAGGEPKAQQHAGSGKGGFTADSWAPGSSGGGKAAPAAGAGAGAGAAKPKAPEPTGSGDTFKAGTWRPGQ